MRRVLKWSCTAGTFKFAFRSVRYTSLFYLAVLVMFVGDQMLVLEQGPEASFNLFYFAGWICAILASVFGYLGYVLPKWLRNMLGASKRAEAKSS